MSGNYIKQVKTRVHLVPSLDYGGLETQMTTLGVEYHKAKRTNTVEFWSLRTGGVSEIKLRELGFTVRVFNSNFRTMNPALVFKLIYLLRAIGVKEVFTHGFESNLNGIIAARLAGVRCVIAEEIGISKHKHLLHFAFKFIYLFVKKLSVQSQQMKFSIENSNEISLKKVVVIYPPVEIDRILSQERKLSSGPLKFVFIGRLEKVKNLNLMLESLYRLKNQNRISNWTLNIYGSGSEAKNLQELVFNLDLQNNVAFRGKTNKALEAISEADWMLLSSESEGFGLVIIESMLCGVPVISTKVGIAEEVIISNKNGYLSPDHSIDSYLNCLLNACAITSNDYRSISNKAISSAKDRFNSETYLIELDNLVEAAN